MDDDFESTIDSCDTVDSCIRFPKQNSFLRPRSCNYRQDLRILQLSTAADAGASTPVMRPMKHLKTKDMISANILLPTAGSTGTTNVKHTANMLSGPAAIRQGLRDIERRKLDLYKTKVLVMVKTQAKTSLPEASGPLSQKAAPERFVRYIHQSHNPVGFLTESNGSLKPHPQKVATNPVLLDDKTTTVLTPTSEAPLSRTERKLRDALVIAAQIACLFPTS